MQIGQQDSKEMQQQEEHMKQKKLLKWLQQNNIKTWTLSQSLQQQAAAGLISTGEAKRNLDQIALDQAYAQFLDAKREPFENINFALGTLQGVPYNTQQYGYNLATNQQQGPSVYGQTLGALGTLGSAYYMGQR